jgi:hypothetical protein
VKPPFIPPYVVVLGTYFRWVKLPLSRLVSRFRPKIAFQPPVLSSLEEYAGWISQHLRWRSDPLNGVLDIFPDLRYLAWQLDRKGMAEEDCDGLAYFHASAVAQFADSPSDIYVVTIVLDPRRISLQEAAHVICIFRSGGKWRVISNLEVYPRRYPTFLAALSENPYCRGRPIKLVEVRDAHLRRVAQPAD